MTEAGSRVETACQQGRPLVLLVTLHVRNACWCDMFEVVQRTFQVPPYLLAMVRCYLTYCRLVCETRQGQLTKVFTSGAAQGSILGPDLLNPSYYSLLRTQMPKNVFLVGYADDEGTVITSRYPDLAQLKLNKVMRRVSGWM